MNKSILVLGILIASIARAEGGKEIGNGGKGIVCQIDTPQMTVRPLDLIKAEDAWGMTSVPAEGADEFKKAENLAKRIAAHEVERSEKYIQEIRIFAENSRMFENYDLFNTDDSTEIGVPDGCVVKVIVNQAQPKFKEDRRYRINAKLWNLLSLNDRAALILHEIIYTEALALGQKTSDGVTYFNAYINSSNILKPANEDTDYDYFKTLTEIGFPYRFANMLLKDVFYSRNSDGALIINRGTRVPAPLITEYYRPGPNTFFVNRFGNYDLKDDADLDITFYPSGQIEHAGAARSGNQTVGSVPQRFDLTEGKQTNCMLMLPKEVYFYETGVVMSGRVSFAYAPRPHGCEFNVRSKSGELKAKYFPSGTYLLFDKDGVVLRSRRFFKFRGYQ